MKTYCEIVTRTIIPAIRALVARQLVRKYGMTQLEVAKKLGVTQPAISYYLRSKRGRIAVERLKKNEEIMKLVGKIVDIIHKGGAQEDLQKIICEICHKIRKEGLLKDNI